MSVSGPSVRLSVSGQNPILPKGICARDMLGASGSFLKMSLLDPSWTKNEPLNPHTQELKLLIGGSFSGEKSQIGTRKSAHSGTKTVDWRIILQRKNANRDPEIRTLRN